MVSHQPLPIKMELARCPILMGNGFKEKSAIERQDEGSSFLLNAIPLWYSSKRTPLTLYFASPFRSLISMDAIFAKHVDATPGVCGGKPRIAGTRIRVQDI